jgi:putative DNA methylase
VKKKLIEVALPLDKINAAAAKEKTIRHGHPSTLHLWWARRPLAACRAVIFASLVDDPSAHPDRFLTEEAQQLERDRLFAILEQLVQWESSNSSETLRAAHEEILKCTGGEVPSIYDPFCGGGSIPFEAQRLGLRAFGSDLNPVAVLITKAMIEIPPRFVNHAPVNPSARSRKGLLEWRGARGLADDVRYYGDWIRTRAQERIGYLYPKVTLPKEMGEGDATVIAWLWTRTVQCPNPACGGRMPLLRSFALSTKKGSEYCLDPVVDKAKGEVTFSVRRGTANTSEGTVGRRGAHCLICGVAVELDHIRGEGRAGRIRPQLMAVVAEIGNSRIYLPATAEQATIAQTAHPEWIPEADLPKNPRDFKTPNYGMTTFASLFTRRQLVALSTFSALVAEARDEVLEQGASSEYADAIATYLAMAIDKMTDTNTCLCTWQVDPPRLRSTFGRQALPMTWDFAEANVFADAAGDYQRCVGSLSEVLERFESAQPGDVRQMDASSLSGGSKFVFCTDPPYYDNIGYADLSDFFYVWLRRALRNIYPQLFSTVLVPKAQELVATPYRFDGDLKKAKEFFENGFRRTFERIRESQHPEYPLTVFYAFKQAEGEDDEDSSVVSTGWETMLEGLIASQFQVTGTWPMRSEMTTRNIGRGANALASSIVLVCRPRSLDSTVVTEMDFQLALRAELPRAVRTMQQESIAPVDLAQAAIGPGMGIYSRYARVLGPDGKPVPVRKALEMINRVLDEALSEQESEFDSDTRFALAWFQQFGSRSGTFGTADVLSRAMNIAVSGMESAGILEAKAGTVRLLKWEELPDDWDPEKDHRLTVWEMTHHLIRLMYKESDAAAARVLAKLGDEGEKARDLAYRLYQICERSKRSQEAQPYNALVVAWPNLTAEARRLEKRSTPEQMTL